MQNNFSISDITPGEHLCCMYLTDEEHRDIVVSFIRDGLQRGDKVVYITDSSTQETVLHYLHQAGLDSDRYTQSGQLVFMSSWDTYLQEGKFDPDYMIQFLSRETDKALEEGCSSLRLTGEMSWALRGLPGSERLMEYEAKLNQFFSQNRAIGLCQYDMRRFESKTLLDVLDTHPLVFVGKKCYDNIYYVPPEDFLHGNRADVELDRRLKNLEHRRRIEAERDSLEKKLRQREYWARREAEFTNAILDNAGALIVILNRDGRIMRFNKTCENLTNYSEKEVLGLDIREVLLTSDKDQEIQRIFNELYQESVPERFDSEWITKDGDKIHVSWSCTCLRDEDGLLDIIVCTGLDITEISLLENTRKREMASLQEYSQGQALPATATSLGILPLSQSHPEEFQYCVNQLQKLLGLAVEKNMYKVEHNLAPSLRDLAERLGILHAGPRDLVQAYIQARQSKIKGLNSRMARLFTDEGRMLLIELMGYLASYYYRHCLVQGEA